VVRAGSRAMNGPERSVDVVEMPVEVPLAEGSDLRGHLAIPGAPLGAVLLVHGSGRGRRNRRNRFVAQALQRSRLATLLLDLLTLDEQRAERSERRLLRPDVDILANRLAQAARWVHHRPETQSLRIGYFGSGAGAAAALAAAAREPHPIGAVVSRGGRLDLAGDALARVRAPTLLIVGGDDPDLLALHREALTELGAEKWLEVVPGAGRLFDEPGALERVADLASRFMSERLGHSPHAQIEDGWV
jgi:putative phosphoribosyl transferase